MSIVQKAVDLAGGQTALASAVGGKVRQGHVWNWLQSGRVPEAHCPAVERITGIKCEELRPDVDWERDRRGRVTAYRVRVTTKAA